ncbi:MAG: DUF1365 domain-containing protein [Halothiobacillaceae bacterium]
MNGSALYVGSVMHRRTRGPVYRFDYRVFSLLVDLDDLEAGFPGLRFLSADRFNLLSFHQSDHGPRDGSALRPWIESACAAEGIDIRGGKVLISAYPRVLGYQFNPLSVWYCHNREGELVAIDAEVSNTFGEHHHYLLHEGGRPLSRPFRARADKVFHVSPFIDMPMRYHFRIDRPEERLAVAIRETEGEDTLLVATHVARRRPLSDRTLIAQCLKIPLLTVKVIGLIHWQALKIWLRGGRFHRAPPLPEQEISSCPVRTPKT